MSFVETDITSSSSSPKRLESLPILSLVTRRNSRKNAAAMPSSASSSSSSSASSTSQQQQQQQQNANNSDQNSSKQQQQSQQNLPLPIIHHPVACTYLGADDGKEFDDVVFDILKVDPDDIAVRNRLDSDILI